MLVVGAGPSGLTAACCLALHGVPLRIVDRAAGPSDNSRAAGIQSRSLEIFEQLGLVDAFLERGRKGVGVDFHTPGGRIRADLFGDDAFPSRYPHVLLLEQSVTEKLLRERLQELGHRVEWGREVRGLRAGRDEATLRISDGRGGERAVAARWVIAADGADSALRHAIGVPFSGSTYEQRYAVADVRVPDRELDPSHVNLNLNDSGFILLVPLARGGFFRLATDFPPGFRGPDEEPTFEDIRSHVADLFPGGLTVEDPHWFSTFRFHSRCVHEFRRGPIFLAGDAAHVHSPVGGQGMNTGIQDAHALAWRLALVRRGLLPDKALDTYEKERLPVARGIVRTTDVLFRIVDHPGALARWLRTRVLPRTVATVVRIPRLRRLLARRVSQIGIRYRHGMLVPGGSRPAAGIPSPGERFPYVSFRREGETRSTPALVGYRRHHLLALGARREAIDVAAALRDRFGDAVACHPVIGPGDTTAGDGAWSCSPPARSRLRAGARGCALVRPDGYTALATSSLDADVVGEEIAAYLGGEGWAPT